jgi:hypothetical protein
MFGSSWLVAPVTVYNASTSAVYLPALNTSIENWVYFFNDSVVDATGWVNLPTPIDEFPLFYRRAVQPPPQPPAPSYGPAASMFDSAREDQVLCVAELCFDNNQASYAVLDPKDSFPVRLSLAFLYALMFVISISDVMWCYGRLLVQLVTSGPTVVIANATYPVASLNLFYSYTHTDNFIATNGTAPDDTYVVEQSNGFVLVSQAPGTVPLQVWFKDYGAGSWDFATFASTESVAWAKSNGYSFQFTTGFVFLTPPGPPSEA